MPTISASGPLATHSVNGVGRLSSGFAAMGRSPIGSPRTLNVDHYTTDFGYCSEVHACLSAAFPHPGSVEELDACFVVKDHAEQKLAYIHYEEEPGRRSAAKLFSKDEARRITVNSRSCPSYCGRRVRISALSSKPIFDFYQCR
jgi:hypothetical protein